jgi:hypothetical protein
VRYFTDGNGGRGKAFVNGVFEANRRFFSGQAQKRARKMRFAEWGELRTARALRVAPVHAPLTT